MVTLFLLLIPWLEATSSGKILMGIGLTGLYLIGLMASRPSRILFRIGLTLAILAVILIWATEVSSAPILLGASQITGALFLLLTVVSLLRSVIQMHGGTVNALYGAATAYLILGLAWAILYRCLETIDPQAFLVPNRETIQLIPDASPVTSFSQVIYFSFVTMSTLGYGDMVPNIPAARTLTWMQSVLGQFYLAVLVARLVSVLPTQSNQDE